MKTIKDIAYQYKFLLVQDYGHMDLRDAIMAYGYEIKDERYEPFMFSDIMGYYDIRICALSSKQAA